MDPTTRTMKRWRSRMPEADRIFTILIRQGGSGREFIETHSAELIWQPSIFDDGYWTGTVSTTSVLR